jgi:hypothetical protein
VGQVIHATILHDRVTHQMNWAAFIDRLPADAYSVARRIPHENPQNEGKQHFLSTRTKENMMKKYLGTLRVILSTVCLSLWAVGSGWAVEIQAPHHGTLVKLGKDFAQVECVLDAAQGVLTLYVLDAETGNPIRLVQDAIRVNGNYDGRPFTVKLDAAANSATGEKKWDTSEFQGRSQDLVGLSKFEGKIFFIRVKGMNFRNIRFQYSGEREGTTQSVPVVQTPREPK